MFWTNLKNELQLSYPTSSVQLLSWALRDEKNAAKKKVAGCGLDLMWSVHFPWQAV